MIKCSASLAFYLFSPTRLINSINHEHSCTTLCIFQSEDGETCMHDAVVQEECQPLLIQAVLNANNFYYSNRNDKGFNVLKWAAVKNNQA